MLNQRRKDNIVKGTADTRSRESPSDIVAGQWKRVETEMKGKKRLL